MIKWEQMVFLGNPEYGCELQPIDFVAFARAVAVLALQSKIRRIAEQFWTKRLGDCGPVIVEAVVDPFVPPMPAKITMDQADQVRPIAGSRRAQSIQNRMDGGFGQGA